MNKRAVESLIKCGALDSLGANRAQLLAIFEKTIDSIHANRKRNVEGQFSLFDMGESDKYTESLPDIKEFKKSILLSMEKEIVGIYLSGHPLEDYKKQIENASSITSFDLINTDDNINEKILGTKDGDKVIIGGIIAEKKNMITKNNNMMAFITLEDLFGTVECIVFPTTFERYNKILSEDNIVVIEGKLSVSEVEAPKIIVEKISELKTFVTGKLYLKIEGEDTFGPMETIKNILSKYKGNMPVYIYFENDKKTVMADRSLWVDGNSQGCIAELKEVLGKESVKIVEA